MTPEEAKPIEMIDENGAPTFWFTAKETAEIAKAFRDSSESDCTWDEWMAKFDEWSK